MARDTQRWRLVSFDIRDPKRYRRVIKVLKGYASRIQYSVFRGRLDDRETERMRWEVARVLDDEDALLVLDLCPHCAARVVSQNKVDDWTSEPAVAHFPGAANDEQAPTGGPLPDDAGHR